MPSDIKPEATSTPNRFLKVKGRVNIHDQDSIHSPIQSSMNTEQQNDGIDKSIVDKDNTYQGIDYVRSIDAYHMDSIPSVKDSIREKSEHPASDESSAEDEPDYKVSEDDTGDEVISTTDELYYESPQTEVNHVPEVKTTENSVSIASNFTKSFGVLAAIILILSFSVTLWTGAEDPKSLSERITELEARYHNQNKDFWLTIKVSIKEIPILDQPRTILFLYNTDSENTMNNILKDISKVAACELTNCYKSAVTVTANDLNRPEIIRDYGKAITQYRHELADSGVMIVRNIEEIAGTSAQALHSFCDDYTPVVKKALILLTLRTNEDVPANRGYMRYVEERLLQVWSDISVDDKFYPLFTRISSTVLKVEA